ncbi:MAG: peroxiredoxin [Myxococcota bacterium]
MPRIEEHINAVYAGSGYRAMGVHVGPDVAFAVKSREDTGISFPVIVDVDASLLDAYTRVGSGAPVFPLAYLIDKVGRIAEIYEMDEPLLTDLASRIEQLLSE